jgi:hypothetical protein
MAARGLLRSPAERRRRRHARNGRHAGVSSSGQTSASGVGDAKASASRAGHRTSARRPERQPLTRRQVLPLLSKRSALVLSVYRTSCDLPELRIPHV